MLIGLWIALIGAWLGLYFMCMAYRDMRRAYYARTEQLRAAQARNDRLADAIWEAINTIVNRETKRALLKAYWNDK